MELSGVEIVALLNILLMVPSLLSVGLLLALVVIERCMHSRCAVLIILEPVLPPERVVVAAGWPLSQPRMSMLTRAPPVSPQRLRYSDRDHPMIG